MKISREGNVKYLYATKDRRSKLKTKRVYYKVAIYKWIVQKEK